MSTKVLLVLLGTQLLFAISDLLGRQHMSRLGFQWSTFASWWFLIYMTIRTIATFGQLYVFTHLQLGSSIALFATANLVMANLIGYLVLGEVLSSAAYIGIMLAIVAFFVVAYAKML